MSCRTLLVRNLPGLLAGSDVEELFKKFGATRIRLMKQKSKMNGCAFVTFSNPAAALEAMKRLHQLEVLGRRLVVLLSDKEHVSNDDCVDLDEVGKSQTENSTSAKKEMDVRFPAISEELGINYPLNIKYKYLFPPSSPSVVKRISETLIDVPTFYWQVLLLMNKMNLPPPFGPTDRAMPLGKEVYVDNEDMELVKSSEESELESGDDEKDLNKLEASTAVLATKRRRKNGREVTKKRRMHSFLTSATESGVGTVSTEPTAPSEVFDVPSTGIQVQKKIEFKLNAGLDQDIAAEPKDVEVGTGTFGTFTSEASDKLALENVEESKFVTFQQLKENRISKEGMDILPVFKNYQPGKPSVKLYIKNLAKQADEKKLKFIYGLFVDKTCLDDEEKFSIRLMKEGRMKGQAFITFPDDESAKTALEHTNGYVFFGKPIVVQFAKTKT